MRNSQRPFLRLSSSCTDPLARIPHYEHLLGLVRQGLPTTEHSAAMDPALARAHADLDTHRRYS